MKIILYGKIQIYLLPEVQFTPFGPKMTPTDSLEYLMSFYVQRSKRNKEMKFMIICSVLCVLYIKIYKKVFPFFLKMFFAGFMINFPYFGPSLRIFQVQKWKKCGKIGKKIEEKRKHIFVDFNVQNTQNKSDYHEFNSFVPFWILNVEAH